MDDEQGSPRPPNLWQPPIRLPPFGPLGWWHPSLFWGLVLNITCLFSPQKVTLNPLLHLIGLWVYLNLFKYVKIWCKKNADSTTNQQGPIKGYLLNPHLKAESPAIIQWIVDLNVSNNRTERPVGRGSCWQRVCSATGVPARHFVPPATAYMRISVSKWQCIHTGTHAHAHTLTHTSWCMCTCACIVCTWDLHDKCTYTVCLI